MPGQNRKIALVDIDQTLVDNDNSAINEQLIEKLKHGEYDEVWLFTGRLVGEVHRHVMNMGNNPAAGWRQQLTTALLQTLSERGVTVTGVSTPADHARGVLSTGAVNPDPSAPFAPGVGWQSTGLHAYEVALLAEQGTPTQAKLASLANTHGQTGQAIATQLAFTDDTEKAGQVKHLLCDIAKRTTATDIIIDFFDDKVENLTQVTRAIEQWQQQARPDVSVAVNCCEVTEAIEANRERFTFVAREPQIFLPSRQQNFERFPNWEFLYGNEVEELGSAILHTPRDDGLAGALSRTTTQQTLSANNRTQQIAAVNDNAQLTVVEQIKNLWNTSWLFKVGIACAVVGVSAIIIGAIFLSAGGLAGIIAGAVVAVGGIGAMGRAGMAHREQETFNKISSTGFSVDKEDIVLRNDGGDELKSHRPSTSAAHRQQSQPAYTPLRNAQQSPLPEKNDNHQANQTTLNNLGPRGPSNKRGNPT